MNAILPILLMAGLLTANTARGATFTVVNTNSTGAGSLHQAILEANAIAGADLIAFNIAAGGLTIRPTNALPIISDPVTIDGSTQPGFAGTPVIELQGVSAGAAVDGLKLATSHSTIRALVINRFAGDGIEVTNGANNTIAGCYVGLNLAGLTDQGNTLNGILLTNSPNNTIGGLTPSHRNYIAGNNQSGVHLGGASTTNNLLLGNFIGLNVANAAVPNSADGVRVASPGNVIGGSTRASRNVISGNAGQGIEITTAGVGTLVKGNSIGTDDTDTLDRGNTLDGILVSGGNVTVGGAQPGEGNLITGNNGDGIEFNGAAATNNTVLGNTVGVSTGLRNSGNGVLLTGGAHDNVLGGPDPGHPNRIVGNGGDGIGVAAAAANTNNTFRVNVIHSNADLGIDLGASGVTVNDVNDADTGANRLQNFPVLTAATNLGDRVVISGNLQSTAVTAFELDFYVNSLFDPTGYGEAELYLGSTTVTTDAGGNAGFTVAFPIGLSGRYLTATATDPFGNTSELGPVVAAGSTVPTSTFTVTSVSDSGPGSLRQAILDANATITDGPDLIRFALPGEGPHLLAPLSALPPLADPVILDGYTQSGSSPNTASTGNNAALKIRLDGASAPNNTPGLTLWAGSSTVRGLAITRFKSSSGHGIEVFSDHNVIEGNFIGVSPDGVTAQGNGGDGLRLSGANNRIGGTTPAARNLISGNAGDGIELNGATATHNVVLGNSIGVSTGLRNSGNGVLMTGGAHHNVVGGLEPGHRNRIVGNGGDGLSVAAAVANTNNTFRGNEVHSNADLGIDLGASGATVNDATDADAGANQLQNYPTLSSATTNSPTAVSIAGSLVSAAHTRYALDFYANAALDLSGFGEGEFYLGSMDVSTDGGGRADFEAAFGVALPGRFIAATATDPNGNTSEFSRWRIAVSSAPPTNSFVQSADFVFLIDASSSMGNEIAAVKSGLGSFVTGLNTAQIDARFAVVLFGGPPELVLDFTTDQLATEAAFDLISVSGALPGVQVNHNVNPEAGLEAIRIVLNGAATNHLVRDNVGGTGPLAFRADARKNLIVVTDENSDRPFYAENRQPGQTTMDPPTPLSEAWQAEVDATAAVVAAGRAFLNVLMGPTGAALSQYGDPARSVSDANFLNYDPEGTLTNLVAAGLGDSLEAQVLAAGLIGRTFNIQSVNTTNFIAHFFTAKLEEIIDNPLPPPLLSIARLPDRVQLTWATNALGFLLETNRVLRPTNGWGVLTTDYGVVGTNFTVTDSTEGTARFYRLRK